ncbi:MAG: PD-(D/E)XK nuclease family protein, partial [Lachnospiraceae bacterium]|nr:PD-(D/E)XK nuclease family protein [Lachnospiraceae bacterium]
MNGPIKITASRAPDLIPGMMHTVLGAGSPLIIVPESFTLTTEQALIQALPGRGFIGTQVFSVKSLIREIRERAGFPDRAVVSSDGRHMILSLLLKRHRDDLLFYRENVNQVSMAEKLARQIDDLMDGGFDAGSISDPPEDMKNSSRMKLHDIALIWREYQNFLSAGYADEHTQWDIALTGLASSSLFQGMDLIIYGFDYINMNLTQLITTAYPLVNSITVGLISETGCGDDHIFELASGSVKKFMSRMKKDGVGIPVELRAFRADYTETDPGIRFLERNIYSFRREHAPDLSAVQVYYAANTTVECLHTAQTLTRWHKEGISWHDMAVAVCDDTAIPAMLPLVLSSAGIPYAARSGISMLLSEYARFFIQVLRSLRTNYRQEEMMKLIKTGFTPLTADETMDMENYVRSHGIDRNRWRRPFSGDDEETAHLEELRRMIMEPLSALRRTLSSKTCTGRRAAEAIYSFMVSFGAYETLLARENELIGAGMLTTADRNRQVWSEVNELLDQLATFAADDHLTLDELTLMLESSISAKTIKSLPQLADSVIISSPNMFYSAGIKAVAVVGLQDTSSAPSAALLTQLECSLLARSDKEGNVPHGIGMTRREAAARSKQDIYQAVASATQRILFSASAALPDGKVLTASQVFRDVEAMVKKQHPENVRGGLMKDELTPFMPGFALERLAVMLRAALIEPDSFLTGRDPESRAWRDALSFLCNDSRWHDRMSAVLDGLHVKIAGPGIPAELAALLYGHSSLSVSAIETAGTCLYWAFLSYALRVHRRRDFLFEADSEGTFSHEVLQKFFDEAMKLPEWPSLSDNTVSALLDAIMEEETKPWENGPLGKNASGRFDGEEIKRNVRTAAFTMANALKIVPHFKPIGMEVGFGKISADSALLFPPVILKLPDGREISLRGKIDRVDTVTLSDGRKAVLIYDFKSSEKDIHGEALDAGLE